MKLYLWREVLSDFTHGVMFALANDVEEARQLITASYKSEFGDVPYGIDQKPEVIDAPFGFHLTGGG